ncbi:Quinic acid utilization activator [Apiospora saccharicola]|uniref:Quinic acid utilization activator n=1 Tax=Apiospora saccharicola TaxID=335842 RepID=A0ABR1VSK3_9PEZI
MPPAVVNATTGKKRQASETDQGEPLPKSKSSPAPKRQRVSRACDQCRGAREKCDGIQPLCFPCASQNRSCTWEEPKKKRGVQTGYIRTLELALGWIFDKIPGTEEALHAMLTHEGGQGRSLLVGKDSGSGSRLHRKWRKSNVHQEIERVLAGGDISDIKGEKPSSANGDSDSGDEAEMSYQSAMDRFPPTAGVNARPLGRTSLTPDRAKTAVTQLPPNCWRLMDIYVSYTHCWFPVLDKVSMQKTSYLYRNEGLELLPDEPNSAAHAELWAALTLASYQEQASQRGVEDIKNLSQPTDPMAYYRIARSLIPNEYGHFEVRHVTALLVLTLVNLGLQKLDPAWIMMGMASRLITHLQNQPGIKSECTWRLHRAYMGCFILDTILSLRLGRTPHLRVEEIPGSLPASLASDENEREEWDGWIPCFGFGSQPTPHITSRSPSHSLSTFSSLYEIHRAISTILYSPLVQRAIALQQNPRNTSADYVTNGGKPPVSLPSLSVLRLAYLSLESQRYPSSVSSPIPILECVEEHIRNFGACSATPLFSTYMNLVFQNHGLDRMNPVERSRWMDGVTAVESVWGAAPTSPPLQRSQPLPQFEHFPSPNHRTTSNSSTANNQLQTPISYYAEKPPNLPQAMLGEIYGQPGHHSTATNVTAAASSHSRQPLSINNQVNSPTNSSNVFTNMESMAAVAGMPSTPHFPMHGRPSFSSGTFDYDAILDDIASLDRTDRMESDPQFMTNLGFAPGSSLADVFTQDFMGYT